MPARKSKSKKPYHEPIVKSDFLPTLRQLIDTSDVLSQLLGPVIEFKVVLDANTLMAEAVWAAGRTYIDAKSALHEAILAGTIIPYATPRVLDEAHRCMPEWAQRKHLDLNRCLEELHRIRASLNILQPTDEDIARYVGGKDPDDAPSLALADIVEAVGVFSRDNHISQMGGIQIPRSFIFHIRDYSRQLAVTLSIKVGGYYLSIGAFRLFLAAHNFIKAGVSRISEIPTKYRLLLLAAVAGIFLHPKSRATIIGITRGALSLIPEGSAAELIAVVIYFADQLEKHRPDPPVLSYNSWIKPNRRGAKLKFENEIMPELVDRITAAGLDKFSGTLLYGGPETVTSGPLYILGYNPGGDPTKVTADPITHLQEMLKQKRGWNEYLDGNWSNERRKYIPGGAPMQRRVQTLVKELDLALTETCASNLTFVRSQDVYRLPGRDDLAEVCWPIHEFILDKIRPQAILSIGGTAVFDFIRSKGRQLTDCQAYLAGHGNWKCYATKIQLREIEMSLVSVPHLSRYAIDHHPDVIRWVRGKLLS